MRAGYSAAPRLPVTRPGYRRPEAGACHRQIIPATGLQGVHSLIQRGQVQINGQRLSGLRFAASSASRAAFSASFCFFTFHFGGVVTLMMVFRLRTGVPLLFSASVSVPVASALSCCVLPLTNHPLAAKDTTPVTAPERPAQPDDRHRTSGKISGPETG